ncbi:hypothetical protein LXL04_029457 [Taraxacum kok-saghyz]
MQTGAKLPLDAYMSSDKVESSDKNKFSSTTTFFSLSLQVSQTKEKKDVSCCSSSDHALKKPMSEPPLPIPSTTIAENPTPNHLPHSKEWMMLWFGFQGDLDVVATCKDGFVRDFQGRMFGPLFVFVYEVQPPPNNLEWISLWDLLIICIMVCYGFIEYAPQVSHKKSQ